MAGRTVKGLNPDVIHAILANGVSDRLAISSELRARDELGELVCITGSLAPCRWSFGLPRENGYYEVESGKQKCYHCRGSDHQPNPFLCHGTMMPQGRMLMRGDGFQTVTVPLDLSSFRQIKIKNRPVPQLTGDAEPPAVGFYDGLADG